MLISCTMYTSAPLAELAGFVLAFIKINEQLKKKICSNSQWKSIRSGNTLHGKKIIFACFYNFHFFISVFFLAMQIGDECAVDSSFNPFSHYQFNSIFSSKNPFNAQFVATILYQLINNFRVCIIWQQSSHLHDEKWFGMYQINCMKCRQDKFN